MNISESAWHLLSAWLFELAGGAIADYEDTCMPKSQREAVFTVAALHQWDMGINDPRCVETAEEWFKDTIAPVSTGGPIPSVSVPISSCPSSPIFYHHHETHLTSLIDSCNS